MITSFTILQQGSTYTFLWRTAVVSVHASNRVDSCWDTTQLRPHQQHELQAAIDSAAQVTSQLHPTGDNDHQRLMRLGSLLFSHLLPPALQDDIRRLPPGSPLSICTNDTELPWELLHDDQDFLALRHVVSRQLLAGGNDRKATGARRRAPMHRFNCLLIGNPNGDLPAADTEVENLLDLLETASQDARVEFLCREHASKVRVLAALASGEYELIHFACHARPGAIRLADGWLESTEIQAVLRGQPLVVVNACNSGRTRGAQALAGVDVSPTAEIEGQTTEPPATPAFPVQRVHSLAHAFLTGGAPVFWGASWPVDDAEARRLVVLFYRALLGGQPLGMALREARRGSRRRDVQTGWPDVTTGMGLAGDTFAWAAPVLYGDPLYRLPTPPCSGSRLRS
ncbi:MAG: CHAT domain-containing protein [Anaerolineales bacterium]|nr:CHAT domain-containing protein [Anaerolineales bacterium]